MIEVNEDWIFDEYEHVATHRFVSPDTGLTHYHISIPKELNS